MPIAAVMALLTALAPLAIDAEQWWTRAHDILAGSAEWTDEYEAQFKAAVEASKTTPQPFEQQQPL